MQTSNFFKGVALAAVLIGLGGFALSQSGKVGSAPVHADVPSVTIQAHQVISHGTFSGLSDHITTGDVKIIQQDSRFVVVLSETFSLDGAPDPVVGFGRSGEYISASQVAGLRSKTGAQTYQLPVDFTPDAYNEIYIWCEKFSVPLGVAALTAA